MNPWQALIAPVTPPERWDEPVKTNGHPLTVHRHILADEVDPETQKPASWCGPRPSKHVAPPAESPKDRGNRILLENLRARPAPILSAPGMTYADAIAVRERARKRQPVNPQLVALANALVRETRRKAMPEAESYLRDVA
jgi:hypothetical protein